MSQRERRNPLYGKLIFTGVMECKTGMHIGAAGNNLDIGGIDSPVVRDPITRKPYVPGSSLKGKMRSLLERKLNLLINRHGGNGVYRHECTNRECQVCRVFGATAQEKSEENIPGRLIVRDMGISNESIKFLSEIETGLQYTEWKFENSLDRITATANPRQIERVPRGSKFNFEIIYTVESDKNEEIREDLNNVVRALKLIEDDALGGHGSRGYGNVKFTPEAFEGRNLDFYDGKGSAEYEEVSTLDDCAPVIDNMIRCFSSEG